MPKNLGPISISDLEATLQDFWNFIKIDFPAPIGTLRYTDRYVSTTENIDGASQTWEPRVLAIGSLSQSIESPLRVDWITFADLDGDWKNYIYNPGIKNIPVTLYIGRWNTETNAFIGATLEFEGRISSGEVDEEVRLTLKPHFPWDLEVPYGVMGGRCVNDFMNPLDCQYPYTPGLTCAKTREACRAYGNEHHINIYDDMPLNGETMMYGGINHGLKNAPEG